MTFPEKFDLPSVTEQFQNNKLVLKSCISTKCV